MEHLGRRQDRQQASYQLRLAGIADLGTEGSPGN
jgi:hypothetical protein